MFIFMILEFFCMSIHMGGGKEVRSLLGAASGADVSLCQRLEDLAWM